MIEQKIELHSAHTRSKIHLSLTSQQVYRIGSDSNNDIVIHDLENYHACLLLKKNNFIVVNPSAKTSLNGKNIDTSTLVKDGDWLSFGTHIFQVCYLSNTKNNYVSKLPEKKECSDNKKTDKNIIYIGRLQECDIQIDSPLVSRKHAKIIFHDDKVFLEDLKSVNGTFINAQHVTKPVELESGDHITIATFNFIFTGKSLDYIEKSEQVHLEAINLTKEIRTSGRTRRLLDNISLVIEPGEFVCIFGTSGSGKSTLLDALNGRRPATSGQLLYNKIDLYSSFNIFRKSIGYVPQQDIVHRKIVMEKALQFTARLRLPPDTSHEEINAHTTSVLDKVGLKEKSNLPIDTPEPLSGGQLKRVSLAVELVANPNILFLDEVTSGLDAGTDKKMMHLFARLAENKKTVICITHTLENIDACSLVVLLHQGKLVYFGPPQEVCQYFGIQKISDVYELIESSSAEHWHDKFIKSPFYEKYVKNRFSKKLPQQQQQEEKTYFSHFINNKWFNLSQAFILIKRYIHLIVADKKNLLILLLQAPLIGLIVGLIFTTDGEIYERAAAESNISFILVLSAIWFGCLNAAREVVKELPIYLRERAVNLEIIPYLISKVLPLAVLSIFQCLILLGIVTVLVDMPGDFLLRFFALFSSSMAATAMGLSISTFVNTNDKAIASLPILLISQVIMANAVVNLKGVSLLVAKLSIISFWAFDSMKSTLSKDVLEAKGLSGELIITLVGSYNKDILMLGILGILFLIISGIGLKLKDYTNT